MVVPTPRCPHLPVPFALKRSRADRTSVRTRPAHRGTVGPARGAGLPAPTCGSGTGGEGDCLAACGGAQGPHTPARRRGDCFDRLRRSRNDRAHRRVRRGDCFDRLRRSRNDRAHRRIRRGDCFDRLRRSRNDRAHRRIRRGDCFDRLRRSRNDRAHRHARRGDCFDRLRRSRNDRAHRRVRRRARTAHPGTPGEGRTVR
ncbi:MAG: hypothetical protein KatS3mg058_4565 [Roseiflexus sp.]|nr:MAG: hypothetical protein KatS3mg058_4565 [Roseiflexus sp.]